VTNEEDLDMDEGSDVMVEERPAGRLTVADLCYALLVVKALTAENEDLRRQLQEANDDRRPSSDRA
jgi:hypothetical protein